MGQLVDKNTIYGFHLVMECQGEYTYTVPSGIGSSLLSKDTLNALEELGLILRNIRRRMTVEGYEVVNGRIQKVNR